MLSIEGVLADMKARLEEERDSHLHTVDSGACRDHAQYKDLTGYCRGLTVAMNLIDEAAKKQNEPDEPQGLKAQ